MGYLEQGSDIGKRRMRLRTIIFSLIAIIGYYVLFQTFYNMIAFKNPLPYDGFGNMMRGVLLNFVPIFVIFVSNILFVFWINRIRRTSHKIGIDFIASLTSMVLVNLFYYVFVSNKIDWAGTVFNTVFIFLGVEVAYYVSHFKQSIEEAERQKQRALQYQYDALKAQVNPHFLFNSLNILYSLISIDQERSKEFVLSLSSMYRYIMSQQGKDKVPLKMEMDFLQGYVSVLGMRYHNQFEVEIQHPELIDDQQVVPYTMQLLIENVTKHNIISSRHHMQVSVVVSQETISISNPIVPRAASSSTHIGLKYIAGLYHQHGKEFVVHNDGQTFTAIVPFI